MLVPHHLNPPSREKGYTPYLGYWLPLAVTKKHHTLFWVFLGNLPETTGAKIPPFPEKMGIRMRPLTPGLTHSEWGGGGAGYSQIVEKLCGTTLHSFCTQHSLFYLFFLRLICFHGPTWYVTKNTFLLVIFWFHRKKLSQSQEKWKIMKFHDCTTEHYEDLFTTCRHLD